MPRRFFRKYAAKRHELADRWFMTPFRHLVHDPRYWSTRRRTVVPAVAAGLFIAFIPTPGHMLIAAAVAVAARINIPVAILTTFVSNPLTVGPMYFLAYRFGAAMLGTERLAFRFEMSLDWVTGFLVDIWQPMLLGCIVLGGVSAVLGYALLDTIWRLSIGNYKTRKRRGRNDP